MSFRTEKDSIGEVKVPIDSYGGSFSVRAKANFQISSLRAAESICRGLALIKKAAAAVNADLGFLDSKISEAIQQAADEFIAGKFRDDFDLDVYQAGAGTPYNMALNEILANRANEILGGKKGEYNPVHPNDHVNMSQSSNDVTPTAIRLAALMDLKGFYESAGALILSFEGKAKEYKDALKTGRTHLQDAVPVTLGQEFEAYASALKRGVKRVEQASEEVKELGIGGTAIGTGINTHPDFSGKMVILLSDWIGEKLSVAENKIESTHSMAAFASLSSALNLLANEILRITNDLRLMVSGPIAGLNEIQIPEVEPGSSIMPGKVNPSILEAMSMICIQVMGLNHSIQISAQQGQFELNWHTPLIGWDLLHQIEILRNGMTMLNDFCVKDIEANAESMKMTLEKSTALATALAPQLGYKKVAELVQTALKEKKSIPELVPEEYQVFLEPWAMTVPNRKS